MTPSSSRCEGDICIIIVSAAHGFFNQISRKDTAKIYATDAILSLLMCAPRSVYPWDIVVLREGNKVFLDKRDGGPFGKSDSISPCLR
jgi:Eukaryotic translation initiation factor 3 subunit 7 (eIF-3)